MIGLDVSGMYQFLGRNQFLTAMLIIYHFLNTKDNVVTKGQMGRLSDKLKTQLSQDYFQYNFQNIGEHSKLRTYVKFKLNSNREDYFDIEDISLKHRKLLCSFRINCHDLKIEMVRYCSPSIAPEGRICKICNIQTETEEHFMLFCPKF